MYPTRYLYIPDGWGGGGCGCGGGGSEVVELSHDFADAVIWNPAIVTDHNGEATITLTLPDTPGQWRLTLYAVTADTQVGETAVTLTTE
jgi:uncharacterized protein YfaS (alpha-2-macroglobulin family)